MLGVAAAALVVWLGLALYRVTTDRTGGGLYHVWEHPVSGRYHSISLSSHPAPFWPRYWRKLLGQPWPGTYVCAKHRSPLPNGPRAGKIVVTVPGDLSRPAKFVANGQPDPSDPVAIALREYRRLIEDREKPDE